ncbi:MAG: hypothetical protein COB85_08135 [Bacteroidetes bacterium]|nr:MAG: hypothetical protein COB85_08135 [Bacteroidota bacterium]
MKNLIVLTVCLFSGVNIYGQHSVILKSGERLQGVVLALLNDTLQMAIEREMTLIDMKEVTSIFFDEYVPYDGSLLLDDNVKFIKSGKYLIEYQMKDRLMTNPPVVSIGTEDKGKVVVEVTVNRTGLVMKAIPGITGSTTSSEYLLTKAKFAAQGARFEPAPQGPIEQKGTIAITY